jgi:ubiquitin-protein ligase E3 A
LAYEGDINDLSLSFEITSNQFGVVSNIPLCANGADLDVNNENVSTFVELYVEFLVSKSIERQYQAFEKGFRRVCSTEVLEICKSSELELIICGQTQVNIEELKIGCQYDDGYHIDHTVIKYNLLI